MHFVIFTLFTIYFRVYFQTHCQRKLLPYHRGKTFQARVLKRMVDVGFLDFETALFVVKQYLPLHVTESEAPVVFLPGGMCFL